MKTDQDKNHKVDSRFFAKMDKIEMQNSSPLIENKLPVTTKIITSGDVRHDHEETTSGIFFGFRILGHVYRLFGLCIFNHAKDVNSLHFQWRRVWPWIVYSFVPWSIVLACMVFLIIIWVAAFKQDDGDLDVNAHFDMALYVQLSANYLLMVILMMIKGRHVVEGVKLMHKLELEVGFTLKNTRKIMALAVGLLLLQLMYCMWILVDLFDENSSGIFDEMNLPKSGRVVLDIIVGIFVLTTIVGSFIIPTWIIFLSVFFRRCFARILTLITTIGQECSESSCSCSQDILRARKLYNRCVETLINCSDILSKGILLTYVINLAICCFSIWLALRDKNKEEVTSFIDLFFTGMLRMMAPLVAVGYMQSEEQSYTLTMNKLLTNSKCPNYIQELSMFKSGLQSENVTFSGCGIFHLDLGLIQGITQAIITYAVILSQTKDIA